MIDYLQAVYEFVTNRKIFPKDKTALELIVRSFSLSDGGKIQRLEAVTNHDFKAIEQFLANAMKKKKLERLIPYVNLGIGSEDVNSIAFTRLVGECRTQVLLPQLQIVSGALSTLAQQEKNTRMVARTHAQAASLTTFGKEVANSLLRLCDEVEIFKSMRLKAKCAGEVGSLEAFAVIDGHKDWLAFTDAFIGRYGMISTHAATQIAPYDSLIRLLESLGRINGILLDFVKNIWLYVLVGYVKIVKVDAEVGSAGLPHKVNPIYFEGAEGGLVMANGDIETISRQLLVNRLQRDFSDSTIRRMVVVPLSLSLLSYQSIAEGLRRLTVDHEVISESLARHPEVSLEMVKVFGTTHGIADMFERLKGKTRGKNLTKDDLDALISDLPLSEKEKNQLRELLEKHENPYPGRIVDEAVVKAKKIFSL
ncbi:hypothetical protein HY086_06425 [Candidatus Gottesmanbacteria bacterium]|nr:hypothetical protein [Candidatus Gottesmanbacteria bacterium]